MGDLLSIQQTQAQVARANHLGLLLCFSSRYHASGIKSGIAARGSHPFFFRWVTDGTGRLLPCVTKQWLAMIDLTASFTARADRESILWAQHKQGHVRYPGDAETGVPSFDLLALLADQPLMRPMPTTPREDGKRQGERIN